MCVILVCPPDVRPSRQILEACHRANPHGAGVAWRGKNFVHWTKDLYPDDLAELLPQLEGEVVIHFRLASVGGPHPRLCHPFPITKTASTALWGSTRKLLFHNGTWPDYAEKLRFLGETCGRKITGRLNDSRTMALLLHQIGSYYPLKRAGGRWVIFTPKETRRFGDWQEWGGIHFSNLNFTYQLERSTRHHAWLREVEEA